MGSPKALLSFEGETFLDRLIGLFDSVCSQVIVVLGHNHQQIRDGLTRDAVFVINPDPDRGQLTSLQCGFEALDRGVEAVFFTPVDFPAIRPGTVIALGNAAGAMAVVPQYRGRHGHPVRISAKLIPEFLEPGPGATARDVMHRHTAQTRYLDVDDPGILFDIDDPTAYQELMQASL